MTVSVLADPAAGPRAARLIMRVDGKEVASAPIPIFYPLRGGGVVGRYAIRNLAPDLPQPEPRGLTIEDVRFTRR